MRARAVEEGLPKMISILEDGRCLKGQGGEPNPLTKLNQKLEGKRAGQRANSGFFVFEIYHFILADLSLRASTDHRANGE